MTNKEKAGALWDLGRDEGRGRDERLAALDELIALKKKAKVGWDSLGIGTDQYPDPPEYRAQVALLEKHADPLEEDVPADDVAAEKNAADGSKSPGRVRAKPAKPEPEVRGRISEMVRGLLKGGDAPYADIVEQVRAKHPHAVTTARSVASVASEMRAKGERVPTRRKPAKASK